MKSFITLSVITLIFTLASCRSFLSTPPLLERSPDTINKPTETILAKDTSAELPRGTLVTTKPEDRLEVVLCVDTKVSVVGDVPQEMILPKNTMVILPGNTSLQTTTITKATIEKASEVVLPSGTEITITKINWYALLFYGLLIFTLGWYYMRSREDKDSDSDGFVDNLNEEKNEIIQSEK